MIIKPSDRLKEFTKMKKGESDQKGLSTGFYTLDTNMQFCKRYMSIWTGYPGSGKSEFLDACLVNCALLHDWKVLFYSPENHPIEQHMSKLAEKLIGKHVTEFSQLDFDYAMEWLNEHFTWMYPDNPELDTLLTLATREAETTGIDCLVIDPWNAVTHNRTQMVHEYLADALTKMIRFARNYEVFISIVAHPTKPLREKDGSFPVPDMYSISDGAMWRNKADYGVVVHRPDMSRNEVQVYVQKVKYKWMGLIGMQEFDYNFKNGRFKPRGIDDFTLPTDIEAAF